MSFNIKYRQITKNQVPDDCSEFEFTDIDGKNSGFQTTDNHIIPVLETSNRYTYQDNSKTIDNRLITLTSYEEIQYLSNIHTYFANNEKNANNNIQTQVNGQDVTIEVDQGNENMQKCTVSEIYVKINDLELSNTTETTTDFINRYKNGEEIKIKISLNLFLKPYKRSIFSYRSYQIEEISLLDFEYDGRSLYLNEETNDLYFVFRIPTYYFIQKFTSYFKDYSAFYNSKNEGFYNYSKDIFIFYFYQLKYNVVVEDTYSSTTTSNSYLNIRFGSISDGSSGSLQENLSNTDEYGTIFNYDPSRIPNTVYTDTLLSI